MIRSLNESEIKLIKYLFEKEDKAKPTDLIGEINKRTLYRSLDSLYRKELIKIELRDKTKVYRLTDEGIILGWVISQPKEAIQVYQERQKLLPKGERRRLQEKEIATKEGHAEKAEKAALEVLRPVFPMIRNAPDLDKLENMLSDVKERFKAKKK